MSDALYDTSFLLLSKFNTTEFAFVSPLAGLTAFYALASLGLGAQLIARQRLA